MESCARARERAAREDVGVTSVDADCLTASIELQARSGSSGIDDFQNHSNELQHPTRSDRPFPMILVRSSLDSCLER